MTITPLPGLGDLQVIEPTVYSDNRGYFYESYSKNWLPNIEFVQANQAKSTHNVLRGLHYQKVTDTCPGQIKLVRATIGRILDVAVDIRLDSPTFGKWASIELSAENHKQLLIPVGFAHGYLVLSETAVVQYLCSNFYDAQTECGIAWNDKSLGIDWPTNNPIISTRDQRNQSLHEYSVQPYNWFSTKL